MVINSNYERVTLAKVSLIDGRQIKAARALLSVDQAELAQRAGVDVQTIRRLESFAGPVAAHTVTVDKVVGALRDLGVELTSADDLPGVRVTERKKMSRRTKQK
jgi:transcriptional regulator with XRE-family HTH domain